MVTTISFSVVLVSTNLVIPLTEMISVTEILSS